MPDEFNLEDIIEKLIFIDKVEKGLKQLDNKITLTHSAVKTKVQEWQK